MSAVVLMVSSLLAIALSFIDSELALWALALNFAVPLIERVEETGLAEFPAVADPPRTTADFSFLFPALRFIRGLSEPHDHSRQTGAAGSTRRSHPAAPLPDHRDGKVQGERP